MTFKSCSEVLGARVAWTVASIGKLISDGRAEGWLEGAALQAVDPRELHATVAALLAATPVDVRIAPIEWLAHRLSLKRVELDALWLLICCEIDPTVSRLVRSLEASGDLSIQLWQRLVSIATGEHLDNAHLENLFDWVLVETSFDAAIPLQRRAVRASDRVVELATGELRLDRKVARFASMLDALEREGEPLAHGQVVVAVGKVGSGRATKLRRAYGRPVLDVRVAGSAIDARQLAALCREAALFGAAPLFRELPAGNDELAKLIDAHVLRSFKGLVLATASEVPTWIGERCVITTTKALTRDERQSVWKHHLPAAEEATLSELADRYSVGPGMIAKVSATVGADATIDSLHAALRHHLSNSVAELATKIEITQTWDDLVLPSDQFEQVIELVARVRHRRQVLDTWGFGAKVGKANGVATLLSGPPGTGKTMVAGLIAKELGLDLYQVDLSRIVSKYIGETEKNLARLFDAAEAGHAVLLFDEADSLFAKRSEVKSSNDRYANLEVNYLLQRIEQFSGIALLTTNHETAIDEAFRRRLALHVRFPMPDEAQRSSLWRAMLPEKAPIGASINFARLANEFEMSGGYIKNAVLRAAYLAADAGCPIGPDHLVRAATLEYEAMGKLSFRRAS